MLRRKVAGDVENQLRDPGREGIDLSVGAGDDRPVWHLIPYFAAKKARSLAGAACATSCHVEILSLVRSSIGFTHFITAYQASARSGLRASIRTQKEHCRA